jgi:hypothetical protein
MARLVRLDVGRNRPDVVLYQWERGWNLAHNIRPEPMFAGIERGEPAS